MSEPAHPVAAMGLRPHEVDEAARIFTAAFAGKLRPFLGDAARARRIVTRALQPEMAMVARQGGQIIGLAGLICGQRRFLDLRREHLRAEYGPLSATVRYVLLGILEQTHPDDEVYIEGIAVDAAARGQGIGTVLLHAIDAYAAAQGRSAVRLDVVDSNPRARQLYEREGYIVTGTTHLPFLRPFLGFGAFTSMVKHITGPGAAPTDPPA
jgi:ribosomal protein S18 acetylase RimI-like enzyme